MQESAFEFCKSVHGENVPHRQSDYSVTQSFDLTGASGVKTSLGSPAC